MRKRHLLGLLCVPIAALGMAPGVVHADGPSTVWKVVIHEEQNQILYGGWAERVRVTYTCPKGVTGVVIDLTVHQSIDSPPHESEGEIDNAGVTCKGEEASKWLTVWAGTSDGDQPFIAGLAALKASLDQPPRPYGWDGRDMANDNRTARLGNGSGPVEWVSIMGGEVMNGGTKVKVSVDYLCSSSVVAADMRAYVDQDLGNEAGSGDAEGLATRSSVPCTGHRESTTVTVDAGKPTSSTEGSAPCEDQNTPPPTDGFDWFFVENDGGTYAKGLACIQVQFGDSVAGDVVAAQEGVFRLES
jgi:hypothetical protein